MEDLSSRVLFSVSVITLIGHSWACMVQIMSMAGKCFEMDWLEL